MKIYTYDCIVIGTGAAGYNAAIRLKEFGVNVVMVTEGIKCGTSRNTGSDKQTYYKLGLGADSLDSIYKMATDLFNGGSMDGDNALCEAALSARCFYNLCELGVPFPANRYGEYVGYKTDHDPSQRATSAGPLTSKFMTEALEKRAKMLKIKIIDNCRVAEILTHNGKTVGIICEKRGKSIAMRCKDIVMATGGPAGIYADTVYPLGHTGSTGIAINAGAKVQNMELWQYGMASVNPRWNVSGTYMQVMPRFVSIDQNGEEHDFLLEYFEDKNKMLSLVFLKGYQWPYDAKKAKDGSSLIDMLVYNEISVKNRKVYLDFTKNPCNIEYDKLIPEAYEYLKKADATFGLPIDRLKKMNTPAIDLYKSKGVDITKEYLQIALCAQHNNGGIAVDLWWQTSVKGLFAVGECAGTHGIARPGGSALNSGQVGSLRAAQYISQYPNEFLNLKQFKNLIKGKKVFILPNADEKIKKAQRRMSNFAGAVRDLDKIKSVLKDTLNELETAKDYRHRDILTTQTAVLLSMCEQTNDASKIKEVIKTENSFELKIRDVRPIPHNDDFYENIWNGYRGNKNIY